MAFYNSKQVQRIAGGKHLTTIWRWERWGWFPKRKRLGPHTVGWDDAEIDAWASDPVAWRERHQTA